MTEEMELVRLSDRCWFWPHKGPTMQDLEMSKSSTNVFLFLPGLAQRQRNIQNHRRYNMVGKVSYFFRWMCGMEILSRNRQEECVCNVQLPILSSLTQNLFSQRKEV
jgi:hypothetical protein